jgi:NADH dehydrogenase
MRTLVVIGAGPTGVETAGALHELFNHVLQNEFHHHDHLSARVILVEKFDRLLPTFPKKLRVSALSQIKSLGVEVIFGNPIVHASSNSIHLEDGAEIPTRTLVWTAGVRASPITQMLDVPLREFGRVPVETTLQVVGQDRIYAIGDIAYLEDQQGKPYPMLIPVAKQQGILAAKNILNRINRRPQSNFHYKDLGIMATIGRRRAVAWIFNRIRLSGFLAWTGWLFLHLATLMGFRNRLNVFANWAWNYLTYDRSVRIILD